MIDLDRFLTPVDPRPWVLPVDHWSPTSAAMFQRCPEQYRRRYILHEKRRPAESLTVGSAVHRAVEENFRQKVASHIDIPLPAILDWYDDVGWPETVEREQERAGEEIEWDTPPTMVEGRVTVSAAEKAGARGRLMLSRYHEKVVPRVQPLAVEQEITLDLGLPVPIVGRFDVERDTTTIDVKTGKSAAKKPKEDWRIQALIYGEARGKPVEFHSVTATAKNTVSIYTPLEAEALLVDPTPHERVVLVDTLKALIWTANFYMAQFGPDEPWPFLGRFHNWACDYCGYRPTCPAWRVE
ncbi:MAG TPA: PD-(D/E)XK nuclease family protein [Candidatus Binatus sp.]|nr:PD-(D/E)XK nuclease family protein [Candidatus Binatus sp.]